MKKRKYREKTKPFYKKFYMSEEEFENLNKKAYMTHFNRSMYLHFIINGIQLCEKLPDDLQDIQVHLRRLYFPISCLQRAAGYDEELRLKSKILDNNIYTLICEIMDTFCSQNKYKEDKK